MNRTACVMILTALALGIVTAPCLGQAVYRTLEERCMKSDVVLVGKLTKIDPATILKAAPGRVPCTIEVSKVLKGPKDLKEVTMLWDVRAEPEGINKEELKEFGRVRYREGKSQIWMLGKSTVVENGYMDRFPYQIEPTTAADAIVTVLKGLEDPAKTLKDEPLDQRQKLSAAYAVLCRARPESRLPLKDGQIDTSDFKLVDRQLAHSAVGAAIQFFPDLDQSEYAASEILLERIGCPVGKLRPETEVKMGLPPEEQRRARMRHRQRWSLEVEKWWHSQKKTIKIYASTKPEADGADSKMPASDDGRKVEVGKWIPTFADAKWNKFKPADIREYEGTLTHTPQKGASMLMRYNPYKLAMSSGTLDVYVGGSDDLKPYVGRKVILRGKFTLMLLEGRTKREIWPAAIKVLK
jgi:hypothetical protein